MIQDRLLHDFIYNCMKEVCYDKEYMYAKFAEAFCEIYTCIYKKGRTQSAGNVFVKGMKTNKSADFHWKLLHRVNYMGHNEVAIECTISDGIDSESRAASFELSLGECIIQGEYE